MRNGAYIPFFACPPSEGGSAQRNTLSAALGVLRIFPDFQNALWSNRIVIFAGKPSRLPGFDTQDPLLKPYKGCEAINGK